MHDEKNKDNLDYAKLIETPEFKDLMQRKKKFTVPYVVLFFIVFFTLPILTSYTSILEARAIGWITWTWMYSFMIFFMVWLLTSIYTRKARSFDKDVEGILKKYIVK